MSVYVQLSYALRIGVLLQQTSSRLCERLQDVRKATLKSLLPSGCQHLTALTSVHVLAEPRIIRITIAPCTVVQ